jgi:DNA-binding NtrC family response regulator
MSTQILIVDDEEIILEETSETLTNEGYVCFTATSIAAAVEIIKNTPGIIIVITDMKMPEGTGADLIETVSSVLGQDKKFIIMSGHAMPEVVSNGIDLSLYPFFKKPLNVNNLIDKIETMVADN